jgi:hypothetical protein
VAQFKSTILLLPNGTILATSTPFDSNLYESEYSITDESLKSLLSEEVKLLVEGGSGEASKKKKKNKSKGNKATAPATTTEEKENKQAAAPTDSVKAEEKKE